MTTSYSSPPPAGGYRGEQPFAAPTLPAPRPARRPKMIGAGVALVAVGGLAAGAAVMQAGTKTQVLAVAHTLKYGQQITANDLTVAHIAADPALSPIAASDEGSVIGKYVGTDVPAGSLLTKGDLATGAIPGPGNVLVGVPVKATLLPVGGVHPADRITVISTPGANDDPKTAPPSQSINATVVAVAGVDNNGIVVISVEASASDAANLTAWGATGRLAVVVAPRS